MEDRYGIQRQWHIGTGRQKPAQKLDTKGLQSTKQYRQVDDCGCRDGYHDGIVPAGWEVSHGQ